MKGKGKMGAKRKKDDEKDSLLKILKEIETEKSISADIMLEAIENSLNQAYKNHFGKSDNCKVVFNEDLGDFEIFSLRTVVDEVTDPVCQILLEDAISVDPRAKLNDILEIKLNSSSFGRIATQNAKNVILQKIREEERRVLFNRYFEKEKSLVTGVVQRFLPNNNISINLGQVDAILPEKEQIPDESLSMSDRVKLYIIEVKDTNKGAKITVSRTRSELVRKLFEAEVPEVADGTVVIEAVAREAGSRSKISVYSENPDVDPVGACVGINGLRVKAVVNDINGENIDIVNWSSNAAEYIENSLSPAKVISVMADTENREARVVVPDKQLSLAIGKEGQNARLAAKLTGYKIDIKSETQAIEDWHIYDEDYYEDDDEYFEEELYDNEATEYENEESFDSSLKNED